MTVGCVATCQDEKDWRTCDEPGWQYNLELCCAYVDSYEVGGRKSIRGIQ